VKGVGEIIGKGIIRLWGDRGWSSKDELVLPHLLWGESILAIQK